MAELKADWESADHEWEKADNAHRCRFARAKFHSMKEKHSKAAALLIKICQWREAIEQFRKARDCDGVLRAEECTGRNVAWRVEVLSRVRRHKEVTVQEFFNMVFDYSVKRSVPRISLFIDPAVHVVA